MEGKLKDFKEKRLLPVLIILLLLAIIGIALAWLVFWHQLNTISVVQIPSKITISGANRSEMQKISLEMTSDDTQVDNKVIIRRVFCIESTADYFLEVAHTTNITDMSIKIFPVSNENSEASKTSGVVKGSDGVRTFYYDPDSEPILGGYINKAGDGNIAIQKGNAGSLHSSIYDDQDVVQQNAEPLYWLSSKVEECEKTNYSRPGKLADGVTDIHYRYYVLEISWTADTAETDMVYLLASHKE